MRPLFRGTAWIALVTALALPATAAAAGSDAPMRNGFRLDSRTIPAQEIRRGGPPRDGIPALDAPPTVPAGEADWDPESTVVGVVIEGEARAYPLDLLVWHELANDELGGVPILVSYCPLCGTAMVFDRRLDGRTLRFGVSGLLYQSDLLMFDRESESLWSQIAATAVTGPRQGARLRLLRSRVEPWGRWRQRHPATRVLTRDTGHARRYGASPYGDYAVSEDLFFPVRWQRAYHPKMPTLGLRLADGRARAYPAAELAAAGGAVAERFAGREVRVAYDPETQVFDVEAPADVEVIEGFWFAWIAFHPESTRFVAEP